MDVDTAEASVVATLRIRHAVIEQWLLSGETKLELEATMPSPIGNMLRQGRTASVPGRTVRLVLLPAPGPGPGYRILTAMVKP